MSMKRAKRLFDNNARGTGIAVCRRRIRLGSFAPTTTGGSVQHLRGIRRSRRRGTRCFTSVAPAPAFSMLILANEQALDYDVAAARNVVSR